MGQTGETQSAGFGHELRTALQRARQVWRLVPRRSKGSLAGTAVVMALTSATCITIPLALGRLIDDVQRGRQGGLDQAALSGVAALDLGLLAGAYLVREGLHVLRRYLVENTCTRLEKDITVRLVAHLMRVDLATLTHQRVGGLQGRIHRSAEGFIRFLRLAFLDFFPAVLTGALALATTAFRQPWLGLVMAGVIPVSLFLTVRQLLSQKDVRLSLLRSKEAMDGTVVELLSGLDYVRAADTHEREVDRLARSAEDRRATELRHHVQMSLFGGAKALNEAFFHLLVLGAAVYFALEGSISFGDVWTFSILFLNVMTPLSEIHRVLDEAHESGLHVGQLLKMLGQPVDRSFAPALTREPRLQLAAPAVLVRDLRVAYRTADGGRTEALDGVSLAIRHGETVGVAGRSGSGKSTWLKVLLRLVHPCSGWVWLGGVPLAAVAREAIGRLVGYVGQTPFLFAGTVAENIAYGNESAPPEEIERVARLAHIHHEILAMPGGYGAPVAERGQNLSGGQQQRIALARVFLKNPPLLVLDEGTSSLDALSERAVQQALDAARKDRTVILVAHRLSTLRHTDRIFVFEAGRVAEAGGYEELVRRGGLFSEFVRCSRESMEAIGPVRLSA